MALLHAGFSGTQVKEGFAFSRAASKAAIVIFISTSQKGKVNGEAFLEILKVGCQGHTYITSVHISYEKT